MATLEEKIIAITDLMQRGILSGDELSKIIRILNNPDSDPEDIIMEKTPLEQKYDDCFSNHIINAYKSPSSCKWPPLTEDMIKEGSVSILDGWSYKPKTVRYIETYIDAPNSYGAMLRQKLRIVIDGDGTPQMVLYKVGGTGLITGLLTANSDDWAPLAGVNL